MDKREYEMTQEQLDKLLNASKPVPYIVAGGVPPATPQQNANRAWEALGAEMGFDWKTVEPIPGRNERFFRAVPNG